MRTRGTPHKAGLLQVTILGYQEKLHERRKAIHTYLGSRTRIYHTLLDHPSQDHTTSAPSS